MSLLTLSLSCPLDSKTFRGWPTFPASLAAAERLLLSYALFFMSFCFLSSNFDVYPMQLLFERNAQFAIPTKTQIQSLGEMGLNLGHHCYQKILQKLHLERACQSVSSWDWWVSQFHRLRLQKAVSFHGTPERIYCVLDPRFEKVSFDIEDSEVRSNAIIFCIFDRLKLKF